MTAAVRSRIFGTGLIVLDLVVGPDPETPVRSWVGGTCGNLLSLLAYLGWDAYPVARMNGDVASKRVCADMERWGVHMKWAHCAPTTHTPMIVQKIRRKGDGLAYHRFSWSCPRCGGWLPPFRARSRLTRWRRSSRHLPIYRCSSWIVFPGAPSRWPRRHLPVAPWWCSSHPESRTASSWRKQSRSRTSSSTLTIALPASAAQWLKVRLSCSRCRPSRNEV